MGDYSWAFHAWKHFQKRSCFICHRKNQSLVVFWRLMDQSYTLVLGTLVECEFCWIVLLLKLHKMLCDTMKARHVSRKVRAFPLVPADTQMSTRAGKSTTGVGQWEGTGGVEEGRGGALDGRIGLWRWARSVAPVWGYLAPFSGLIYWHVSSWICAVDIAGTGPSWALAAAGAYPGARGKSLLTPRKFPAV